MVVPQSLLGGCWDNYCPLGKALGQILEKLTSSPKSCSQAEPEEHAGAGSGEFRNMSVKNLWPGEGQMGAEGVQIDCAGLQPVWVSVKGWDCKGWAQLGTAGFAAPFHPRDAQSAS